MTGVKLDYKTDDKLILLLEDNRRGVPSYCMGNHHVKCGERKIVYEDMTNLYGWMCLNIYQLEIFVNSTF